MSKLGSAGAAWSVPSRYFSDTSVDLEVEEVRTRKTFKTEE